MKTALTSFFAATFVAAVSTAAPVDDLAAAALKLAEAPNYAWTSTTEIANSQFPAMPVEGVTENGGFTVITRSFNGNSSQTVRKGAQTVTQNRDGDWMTTEEMRAQFAGGGQGAPRGGQGGQRGGQGGAGGRGGFGGGGFGFGGFGGGAQSNPADTIANYVTKLKDLTASDGVFTASVTGAEAAALLAPPAGARGGRGQGGGQGGFAAPTYSSVTVKFWVKDGAVSKYTLRSVGKFSPPNGEEREIDSTTTVEIKNVGSAKVTVPEAAKKKFTP